MMSDDPSILARVRARRAELVASYEKLIEQSQQIAISIERTRGAIVLCDEVLQPPQNGDTPPVPEPPPTPEELKPDDYA